jgi:hypothetical protein
MLCGEYSDFRVYYKKHVCKLGTTESGSGEFRFPEPFYDRTIEVMHMDSGETRCVMNESYVPPAFVNNCFDSSRLCVLPQQQQSTQAAVRSRGPMHHTERCQTTLSPLAVHEAGRAEAMTFLNSIAQGGYKNNMDIDQQLAEAIIPSTLLTAELIDDLWSSLIKKK